MFDLCMISPKHVIGQVGLYGVNLIGQPTSTANSEGDWWVSQLITWEQFVTFDIFDLERLEDGDVLSPYDDLSFLMYTDSEVIYQIDIV